MSGIAGLIQFDDKPVDPAELAVMLGRLAHRGPDGSGSWVEGSAGLGHQMFHTTPESQYERLPLCDGDLVLTANARLDNRQELIAMLGLRSEPADTLPDSQIILAAYRAWNERCAERLLGDFAFAVWDRRRETLFCARDPVGMRPLYYWHRPGKCFLFGSEIKALTCLARVPCRLNEVRIADYLADVLDDPAITFYQDIWRLPAAHTLSADRRGLTLRRYWLPNPEHDLGLRSDEQYAQRFQELLCEAVRARMRSIGPRAAYLSGGLDSSCVTGIMRQVMTQCGEDPLLTFSAVWKGYPESDEAPFIRAVNERNRSTPHTIHGDEIGPLSYLDELCPHVEQPSDNIFSSLGWVVRGIVRDHGVRVILDGSGGDITVSYDFTYLADLARSLRWITLWCEAGVLARTYLCDPQARWRLIRGAVLSPLVPPAFLACWRRVRHGVTENTLSNVGIPFNRTFVDRIGFADRYKATMERYRATRSANLDYVYAFEQGMVSYSTEFTDKINAAFGHEIRSPFFDRRLIDFCVALPREQRVNGGMTRPIERRAFQGLLPECVFRRGTKGDPNRNFGRALLGHERQRLERFIYGKEHSVADYVDMAAFREVYARLCSRRTVADAYTVWRAAALEVWLRGTAAKPSI